MPSLKKMMNAHVKLEALPQSIIDAQGPINLATEGFGPPLLPIHQPRAADNRKRGRQKKGATENNSSDARQGPFKVEEDQGLGLSLPSSPGIRMVPNGISGALPVKKKRNRFNGMTEEEVLKRKLPDRLAHGLDILIVGINPGLTAAFCGHHYSGPGNHFWKCLYLSGLISEPMKAVEDFKLLDHGIGFTNIVERTSRGSSDISKKEIREGAILLGEKMRKYNPKIAVFNGKGIFETFVGHKNFYLGKQPQHFPDCEGTLMFVMPSSSARCSQLPRAVDKVPFYTALKKLRDHIRGDIAQLDESDVTFPGLELKTVVRAEAKQEPGKDAVKKDKCQKASPSIDLGAVHQHMVREAVNTVRREDGFMQHGLEPFGGMHHPPTSHHHQQQQDVSMEQMSNSEYGVSTPSTWLGLLGIKQENLGRVPGGYSGSHSQLYSQHPHNYGSPQMAHTHPSQVRHEPLNSPLSFSLESTGWGGTAWLPPPPPAHQHSLKREQQIGQPPPYAYLQQHSYQHHMHQQYLNQLNLSQPYTTQHTDQQHMSQQHTGQHHMDQQHTDQQRTGQQETGQQHTGQHHMNQQHTDQQHKTQQYTDQHNTGQPTPSQQHSREQYIKQEEQADQPLRYSYPDEQHPSQQQHNQQYQHQGQQHMGQGHCGEQSSSHKEPSERQQHTEKQQPIQQQAGRRSSGDQQPDQKQEEQVNQPPPYSYSRDHAGGHNTSPYSGRVSEISEQKCPPSDSISVMQQKLDEQNRILNFGLCPPENITAGMFNRDDVQMKEEPQW